MAAPFDREAGTEAYALLALATVGYFLYMFSWFSLAAYLPPIARELGLSGTEAGIVTGAVQLSYVPLSLVSGLAIDRLGSRRSLAVGLLVIGAAHVLRGIAAGFVALLGPTLLLGVGGTAITFGLPKLVSELFPAEVSGSASSVYVVGATLGSAAAFGLARPLLGPAVGGWRPLFLATGVAVAGFALLWAGSSRALWDRIERRAGAQRAGEERRGEQRASDRRAGEERTGEQRAGDECASEAGASDERAGERRPGGRRTGGARAEADEQTFSVGSLRADLHGVLTHRGLLLLVVVGTARLLIGHGLSAWLPTILEARGLAAALAGTITGLFVVVRIAGIVAIPVLSDRLSSRRQPIVACGVLGAVGMGGLLVGSGLPVVLASLALVGVFVIGGLSPLVRAIPIELAGIGPRRTAAATGLIFTVGEVGGFAGPFVIGALRDLTGSFAPGLAVLAIGSLATVVAGYLMEEPADADRSTTSP